MGDSVRRLWTISGQYNLAIIDKRRRYPGVEPAPNTSFRLVKEKLKNTFATYGTPRKIESINGAPFSSRDNEIFAKEGFDPYRVTQGHSRANKESEKFMQTLKKAGCIATLEGKVKYRRQETILDIGHK